MALRLILLREEIKITQTSCSTHVRRPSALPKKLEEPAVQYYGLKIGAVQYYTGMSVVLI